MAKKIHKTPVQSTQQNIPIREFIEGITVTKDNLRRLEEANNTIILSTKTKEDNILKEKKNILNEYYEETEELNAQKDKLFSDLDNKRVSSQREYEELRNKYSDEKSKLLRNNEILRQKSYKTHCRARKIARNRWKERPKAGLAHTLFD